MERELKLGNDLPEGEAKKLFDRFEEFKTTLPADAQRLIPNAVCFSIDELQGYLSRANEMMETKRIPVEQRGIALMFGKNDESAEKTHLRDKVTVMLVASRVTGDEEGRITEIGNCVIREGEFPEPGGSPDDVSYDVGSLNP